MSDADWTELLPCAARWRTGRIDDPAPAAAVGCGRDLGRQALGALLGAVPAGGPGRGDGGQPLWPGGVVGSVTHAAGHCAVAVAPADRVCALGIDMEPLAPLPPAVWPRIFDAAELEDLLGLPAPERGIAALSRWCLKEALFKALKGRAPLERLPLRREKGEWRPAPALCAALRRQGMHDPERLVLRCAADGSWLRATAWHCA